MVNLASKDQLRGMEEVCVNIIKNTVPLTPEQELICKRWKKPLRLLALKRYPNKKKKELMQKGGFLGAILPIIASVLGSVLAR
jgi:hypothetical protein